MYVGGSYGPTDWNVDCSGTSSCDKSDTGYKIYAGYKFNQLFAIEAGYANLGKTTASAYVPYLTSVQFESTAPFIVGTLRGAFTPQLTGVARFGIANVETKLTGTVSGFAGSASDSSTQAQPIFGLALEYGFNKHLSVSVDADFTNSADVANTGHGAIRMLSIGAQYNF